MERFERNPSGPTDVRRYVWGQIYSPSQFLWVGPKKKGLVILLLLPKRGCTNFQKFWLIRLPNSLGWSKKDTGELLDTIDGCCRVDHRTRIRAVGNMKEWLRFCLLVISKPSWSSIAVSDAVISNLFIIKSWNNSFYSGGISGQHTSFKIQWSCSRGVILPCWSIF